MLYVVAITTEYMHVMAQGKHLGNCDEGNHLSFAKQYHYLGSS
jgi:hypothetical protein